jgi:hypothetical protein
MEFLWTQHCFLEPEYILMVGIISWDPRKAAMEITDAHSLGPFLLLYGFSFCC